MALFCNNTDRPVETISKLHVPEETLLQVLCFHQYFFVNFDKKKQISDDELIFLCIRLKCQDCSNHLVVG